MVIAFGAYWKWLSFPSHFNKCACFLWCWYFVLGPENRKLPLEWNVSQLSTCLFTLCLVGFKLKSATSRRCLASIIHRMRRRWVQVQQSAELSDVVRVCFFQQVARRYGPTSDVAPPNSNAAFRLLPSPFRSQFPNYLQSKHSMYFSRANAVGASRVLGESWWCLYEEVWCARLVTRVKQPVDRQIISHVEEVRACAPVTLSVR